MTKETTMISQTEFRIQHRKYLDDEFIKTFPQGQFIIQRRGDSINIYVNFKRRTSNASWCYPLAFGIEKSHTDDPVFVKLQNNAFGKITTYKTLDKFLTACDKFLITKKAIKTFLSYYNRINKQNKKIYNPVLKKEIELPVKEIDLSLNKRSISRLAYNN